MNTRYSRKKKTGLPALLIIVFILFLLFSIGVLLLFKKVNQPLQELPEKQQSAEQIFQRVIGNHLSTQSPPLTISSLKIAEQKGSYYQPPWKALFMVQTKEQPNPCPFIAQKFPDQPAELITEAFDELQAKKFQKFISSAEKNSPGKYFVYLKRIHDFSLEKTFKNLPHLCFKLSDSPDFKDGAQGYLFENSPSWTIMKKSAQWGASFISHADMIWKETPNGQKYLKITRLRPLIH